MNEAVNWKLLPLFSSNHLQIENVMKPGDVLMCNFCHVFWREWALHERNQTKEFNTLAQPRDFFVLSSFITTHKRSLQRLCFHRCLSVHRGSLPRGVSVRGVSVQGISVQGGLCPGGLCPGWVLSRGISVQGGFCQGDPRTEHGNKRTECMQKMYWVLGPIHIKQKREQKRKSFKKNKQRRSKNKRQTSKRIFSLSFLLSLSMNAP